MTGVIEAIKWLLLRLPSENHKIIQLEPGQIVSLGKYGTFLADSLIGKHFGYTYSINADKSVTAVDQIEFTTENDVSEQTMMGDKIEYLGTNTLSMSEIEELKRQGLKGEEIIEKITTAHQDFQKKTEFSKAKYLRRKKKKYLQQFTPEPITTTQLLEIYRDKDAQRVLNMGLESLALILAQANIHPGGHYLVVDETPSLITAAILEKLGGLGSVTIAHENEHTNLDALKYFDNWLPVENPNIKNPMVRTINFLELFKPEENLPFTVRDPKSVKSSIRAQYYRQLYREQQRSWIYEKCKTGFDGLVIASSLQLPSLVSRMLGFVGGSAPVVVFSEYKERLVDLTLGMKHELRLLAPTILETRVRKYQTLPGRMHPRMTSKANGGYVLYGIRVHPSEDVQALGKAINKRRKKNNTEQETSTPESISA